MCPGSNRSPKPSWRIIWMATPNTQKTTPGYSARETCQRCGRKMPPGGGEEHADPCAPEALEGSTLVLPVGFAVAAISRDSVREAPGGGGTSRRSPSSRQPIHTEPCKPRCRVFTALIGWTRGGESPALAQRKLAVGPTPGSRPRPGRITVRL